MKKLDNIATGEVFKNYSALCTALDEPQKTGKSKQLQLLDWQRYFAYEKQGHKFIITEIFEEPKEKVKKQNTKYTSNNRINIRSMIDLLQSNLDYTKGQFYSYTSWFCDVLGLLDKTILNLPFADNLSIQQICEKYHLQSTQREEILIQYIFSAKRYLQDIFLKSLAYLNKKEICNYLESYEFFSWLTDEREENKNSIVHVCFSSPSDSVHISNAIYGIEKDVCNEMNAELGLSKKLHGRQLLFVIYNRQKLIDIYQRKRIKAVLQDEFLSKCFEYALELEHDLLASDVELKNYFRIVSISEMKNHIFLSPTVATDLRKEITNAVRKKVRKNILDKFHYLEMQGYLDIVRTEQALFLYCDETFRDDSDIDWYLDDTDDTETDNYAVEDTSAGIPF